VPNFERLNAITLLGACMCVISLELIIKITNWKNNSLKSGEFGPFLSWNWFAIGMYYVNTSVGWLSLFKNNCRVGYFLNFLGSHWLSISIFFESFRKLSNNYWLCIRAGSKMINWEPLVNLLDIHPLKGVLLKLFFFLFS
jgi:hypothetical protein